MLILNHIPPLHWSIAGVSIGAITLLMLWTTNRRLGISTTYENLCSLFSSRPYFRRAELTGKGAWRLTFALGLVLGGALSAVLGGGWTPIWDMGMFDRVIEAGPLVKVAWMFGGGLLVGFGTRLADGCTSGHGIFGLANLERPSLVAVLCFMATGILTTQIIYGWLFR